MFVDNNLIFCDEVPLTTFTSGVVGDVVDFGRANRLGEGQPFYIYAGSSVEVTATGDPTIDITLESSDDETFASGVTTFNPFPTLKKADFGPGAPPIVTPCPYGTKKYGRLKLEASDALACITLNAGLTLDPQTNM
jgi:hypothetical protein